MAFSQDPRLRRRSRQRFKIRSVSSGKLRLSVHRSNQHLYAQIIDDVNGCTLASASTMDGEVKALLNGKIQCNKQSASFVGEKIAARALEKGITQVVFDRSGFLYHGRIKELADAARRQGLSF